jgi:hypothetical protein
MKLHISQAASSRAGCEGLGNVPSTKLSLFLADKATCIARLHVVQLSSVTGNDTRAFHYHLDL